MQKTINHVGDRVRCVGLLKQTDGALVDPSLAFGWYKSPNGATVILAYANGQIIRDSVGTFRMDIDIDAHGEWFYGFYSTGTGKAASVDGVITVAITRR